VIDYAAAFAALNAEQLAELLTGSPSVAKLETAVADWFSDVPASEFVEVLADRCVRGDIDIVLACDRIPAGLADLGRAFGQLSALAFRFQLVEITPWVRSGGEEIIFTNTTKARTEIVARSVVEVSWVGHAERPTVSVASTPLDDVEAALVSTRTPGGLKRTWSAQEIRQAIEEDAKLSPAKLACALRLLQFCVDHSAEGRITNQATVYPTFAFRIQGARTETAVD
jgi:hypothetical protein